MVLYIAEKYIKTKQTFKQFNETEQEKKFREYIWQFTEAERHRLF